MTIYEVTDPRFKKYGRIVNNVDITELVSVLGTTPVTEGVVYEPSVKSLETLSVFKDLQDKTFGELPIQIGYCNGHNYLLNAVEYHRSSEINITATPAIFMVGMQQDITDDFTYDTSLIEAFVAPAGVAIELYATTLHYAPCSVDGQGFQVAVVLPRETNYSLDLTHKDGEDKLITAKNKWLIAHEDGGCGICHVGLIGENLDVRK